MGESDSSWTSVSKNSEEHVRGQLTRHALGVTPLLLSLVLIGGHARAARPQMPARQHHVLSLPFLAQRADLEAPSRAHAGGLTIQGRPAAGAGHRVSLLLRPGAGPVRRVRLRRACRRQAGRPGGRSLDVGHQQVRDGRQRCRCRLWPLRLRLLLLRSRLQRHGRVRRAVGPHPDSWWAVGGTAGRHHQPHWRFCGRC